MKQVKPGVKNTPSYPRIVGALILMALCLLPLTALAESGSEAKSTATPAPNQREPIAAPAIKVQPMRPNIRLNQVKENRNFINQANKTRVGRQSLLPDLAVTQSVMPMMVAPGDTVTYTIEVSYDGFNIGTGIWLTDTVPAELLNIDWQASGLILTPSLNVSYTWQIANMTPGDRGIITLTGVVDPNTLDGTIFNTVSVSTDLPEDRYANNDTTIPLQVVNPVADVWLTKTVFPATAFAGDWVTYTLTFGNQGTAVATGVTIDDTIPTELINDSYTSNVHITDFSTQDGWYVEELAPGSMGIITLTAQLSPALAPTSFDNEAYISTSANEVATFNNRASANVMVTDLPFVRFKLLNYEVSEADGYAIITIELSHVFTREVTVDYDMGNYTASTPEDYTAINGTLTFRPGITEQNITVPIINDNVAEDAEMVELKLANAIGAILDIDRAYLTILDDERGGLRIDPTNLTVTEGGAAAAYQVALTVPPRSNNVMVRLTPTNREVTLTSLELTFTPSNWNIPQTVMVTAIDDNRAEGLHHDIINHVVLSLDPAYANITPTQADVSINDNDVPFVSFSQETYHVSENDAQAVITVHLSETPWVTATVDFATFDDMAKAGVDYIATSGELIFPPGVTAVSQTIALLDNTLLDGNKTVGLELLNPANIAPGNITLAELLIVDNETTPTSTMTLPDGNYDAPNYAAELTPFNWSPLYTEAFEAGFPSNLLTSFYDYTDTLKANWGPIALHRFSGVTNTVLWPATLGDEHAPFDKGYPQNMYSVLQYGPLDFSKQQHALVGFGLWHDIDENSGDALLFCASITGNFNDAACSEEYWTGQSDGWITQAMDLGSYAGYKDVTLYWVFISDDQETEPHAGAFIDEIHVWGHNIDALAVPEAAPDPHGSLVVNGDFETGMDGWDVKADVSARAIELSDIRAFDGQQSARMVGAKADYLYQTLDIPDGVWNLDVNFWYTLDSQATDPDQDWFCASVREHNNWDNILVDLGCADSYYAADFEDNYWQEVLVSLMPEEVMKLRKQKIDLVFELYNQSTGAKHTAVYVDKTHLYVSGGEGAGYLDPHEFNDLPDKATLITCGQTITGVVGNALGGYDVDWFKLAQAPVGEVTFDLDAATLLRPSTLNAYMEFYDHTPNFTQESEQPTAINDDDGISTDSYITHTVTAPSGPYYLAVTEYNEFADSHADYQLTVSCGESLLSPKSNPIPDPIAPSADWTVMLYLNAEDKNFEQTLTKYRTDLEAMIGTKASFLNIVALYDGPAKGTMNNPGTTRYLIQPNGVYTDGVNRWSLGEQNMGDPRTLADFTTWAMDNYPAKHYFLAIDDHGDGAYGISQDTTSNDLLTPPELYGALKQATNNGQRKIDIIDYEACLMGLAENAYDLKEFANYLVFFEQISWGIDTYPQYFRDLQANDEPLAVAKRIVSRYHDGAVAANDGRGYPHTISLIDLSKMDGIAQTVNALGKQLLTRLAGSTTITDINRLRDQAQAFANSAAATNPRHADYIDLWDLAAKVSPLAPAEAQAVKQMVETAVITQYKASGKVEGIPWDHRHAHGISIYYPTSQFSSAFFTYPDRRLSQGGSWDEFLTKVVPLEIEGGNAPGGDSGGRGQSARGQSARGQSARAQEKFTTVDLATFIFKPSSTYLPLIVK